MAENKLRSNLNSLTINGGLVKEPELKKVTDSYSILEFSIANNYLQKKGESFEQQVNYFDVKVPGKRGEGLAKVLHKGFGVSILGNLRQERWTNKEGKTASRVVIVANEVEITHWSNNGDKSSGTTPSQAPSTPAGYPDDIPF